MARVTDEHIEARKGQILDAAWACFGRNGYHRTTIQDIATEAGLSAGAIYTYFPGKEAILAAINQRSQAISRALVDAAAAGDGDPIRSISVIGEAMMRFFHDPAFETIARINMEIWPEILRHEDLRNALGDEMRFWRLTVTKIMTDARDRGDLRADVNPEALAQVLICSWEGMRHYRTLDAGFAPEALVELFRSLLSEQAPERALENAIFGGPLGIPHGMPPEKLPSQSKETRSSRKRAKV